jgi:hypothetical protein
MHRLNYPETTKWIVAHNGVDIYGPGKVEPQNCFATGQPYLDIFDTKEEAISAYPSLSSSFLE